MSAAQFRLSAIGRVCLIVSFAASAVGFTSRQPPGDPTFVAGQCPAHVRTTGGVDSSWIRCGTVTVPQDRDHPNRKLAPVVLPVVIYQAPTAHSKVPLMFFAGGPGEPAIDIVTDIFLPTPVGQLMLRERPIIVYNQRGIGSENTGGTDLGMLAYRWRATRDESIQTLLDSARNVASRLRKHGIDPANYTTLHIIDDARDVLHALGYEKMMIFGTSYGTRVALEIMRVYPAMVEAAVLDGVAPPQRNDSFDPAVVDDRRRAVATRLVDDCEKSPTCQSEYHELRRYADDLNRTDAPPVHIVVHLPTTGGWFDLDLRGRDLLSAIGAYAGTDYTRALPQVLEELARGDTVRRPISPELVLHVVHETAIARTAGPNYPVIYHIMLCGDIPSGVLQAGGRGVCEALGVPFGGPDAIAPVTSDVPTLMLSSEYDAQTPPDMAEEASRTLSRGFRVLFPGVGHLAYARLMTAPCVAVIVNAFLLDTSHQPPDPCSHTLLPSFLPRSADLILVPR